MRRFDLCLVLFAMTGATAASMGVMSTKSAVRQSSPAIGKTLALRGGAMTRSEFTLGLNAFISSAYGLGFTLNPNAVLAIYVSCLRSCRVQTKHLLQVGPCLAELLSQ